jgi:hypothetical protein
MSNHCPITAVCEVMATRSPDMVFDPITLKGEGAEEEQDRDPFYELPGPEQPVLPQWLRERAGRWQAERPDLAGEAQWSESHVATAIRIERAEARC